MVKNRTEIDVRYAETDQMGVVHHSSYLVWFEVGRTNFMKQHGFNYAEMEKKEIVSPVIDVHISYKKPVIYGETVTIETWLKKYDGVRTTYGYNVVNKKSETVVFGTTEHVIVRKADFKPVLLRKVYPSWHECYKELTKEE